MRTGGSIVLVGVFAAVSAGQVAGPSEGSGTVVEWSVPEPAWAAPARGGSGFPPVTFVNSEDFFYEHYFDAFNPDLPKGCTAGGQPGDTGCAGNFPCKRTSHTVRDWNVLGHGPTQDGYQAGIEFRGGLSTRNFSTGAFSYGMTGQNIVFEVGSAGGYVPLWEVDVSVSVEAAMRVDRDPVGAAGARGEVTFSGTIGVEGDTLGSPVSGDPVFAEMTSGLVDDITMTVSQSRLATFRGRGDGEIVIDPGFRFSGWAGCPTMDCVRIDGEWQDGDGSMVGFLIGWCDDDGTPPFCGTQSECGGETVAAYPSPGGFDWTQHGVTIDVGFRFIGWDCNGNFIPDIQDIASGLIEDWDGNGRDDQCDIDAGTLTDCNDNRIPDIRELAEYPDLDWNLNGIHDSCDIDSGVLTDCDGDEIPDEREVAEDPDWDWNANGVPDNCDIDSGVLTDCDGDGYPDERLATEDPSLDCNRDLVLDDCQDVPDEDGDGQSDWCQIVAGAADCNGNLRLDSAEIAVFDELDCNQNGLPDACEMADLPALDADGDGILDDCVPRWTPIAMSERLSGWVLDNIGDPQHWAVRAIGANGWTIVRVRVDLGGSTYEYAWLRHNLESGVTDRLSGIGGTGAVPMINGVGEATCVHIDDAGSGDRRRVYYWPAGQSDPIITLDVVEFSTGTSAARSLHESGWFIADWALNTNAAPRLINARTGAILFLDHYEDYDAVDGTISMELHRITKDGRIFGKRIRSGSGTPGCVHSWAGPFASIESTYCSAWQCEGYTAISSATGIFALMAGQAYGPCGGWRETGNRIYDAFGNEYGSRVIDNRSSTTSRAGFMVDQVLDGGQIIASPSTSDGEKIVVVWPTLSSETYFDARELLAGDPNGLSDLGKKDIAIIGHDRNPMISHEGSFVLDQTEQIGVVHMVSFPAPLGLDLTADGEADDGDLLALVAFLAGQGPEPAGDADLNRDGSVDEADAQALAWWLIASRAETLPDCDGDGTPDLAQLARFGGTLPDDDHDLVPDGCGEAGCNLADLVPPLGLLDLADVVAFVDGFAAGDAGLDFDGSGLLDLGDIVAFVTAFGAGCP